MIEHRENLADKERDLLQNKFRFVLKHLNKMIMYENTISPKNFRNYFQSWWFNSISYDLQVIKPILIWQIEEKIDFVIKKANYYFCVKTD